MSAPGLKITNFHYSNVTLPTGNLTEYPKWVKMSGFPDAIAKDAEEEAELLARTSKPARPVLTLKAHEPK